MADSSSTSRASGAYEADAVDVKRVLTIAAIIVATIVASGIGVALLSRSLESGLGARPPFPQAVRPPPVAGPALQATPTLDLDTFRAEKQRALREYRWIDEPKGIVQIPIEQAMRRLAERGTTRGDSQ